MDDLISREDVYESMQKLHGVGGIYLWDPEQVLAVIEKAPAVDAVPVERLGNWGRQLMPSKGDPRGRRGAMGVPLGWTPDDILNEVVKTLYRMNPVEDAEGDLWIPVMVDDLQYLICRCREKATAVVRDEALKMCEIPDCTKCAFNDGLAYWHQCEHCIGEARNNFVPISEVKHEAEP